jgi:hypothetical protein
MKSGGASTSAKATAFGLILPHVDTISECSQPTVDGSGRIPNLTYSKG